MFSYDMGGQAAVQDLLATHGVRHVTHEEFEGDESWIGTKFLVMPRCRAASPVTTRTC